MKKRLRKKLAKKREARIHKIAQGTIGAMNNLETEAARILFNNGEFQIAPMRGTELKYLIVK